MDFSLDNVLAFLNENVLPGVLTIGKALLILLVGWIIARFIGKGATKLLKKIGAEELGNKLNNLDALRQFKIKLDIPKILGKTLYWLIMLIVMMVVVETLQMPILSAMIGDFIAYIPDLFKAVGFFLFGLFVASMVQNLIASACKSFGIKAWKAIGSVVFFILMISITLSSLNQARVDTEMLKVVFTLIIGGAALAFSLAYGLAARNVLASLITSFYQKNTFSIGQVIEVDGHKGAILELNQVSAILKTETGKVVIPRNRLLNDTVIVHD
ncbi:MAG: mechanosensitive ion channel domain-containing protein [Bacteroidia bacterium]